MMNRIFSELRTKGMGLPPKAQMPFPIPHSTFRIEKKRSASSLITTLLVLVVLSTVVVAFMQSMSIERNVAQSAMNRCKAEQAAEAGLNYLVAQLIAGTRDDSFVVVTSTNSPPYTFLGTFTNAPANSVVYTPLFSGGAIQTNAYNSLPTLSYSASFPDTASNRPSLDNGRQATTRWITLTNSLGETNARFCYWAEDLQAAVNLKTAGNTNNSGAHSRPTGTNVNEIALYALFSTNSVDTGTTIATSIVTNRSLFITTDEVRQLGTNASNNLALIPPYTERLTIPYGFNYQDQGKERTNINTLISQAGDTAVTAIASVINANLTNFASVRRGGMTNDHDYVKTIAANIIDYADVDNTPTVSANITNAAATGKYRGVDTQPYITEFAERLEYVSKVKNGSNWIVTITVTPFLELWNMGNLTTTGIISFDNKNEDIVKLGFNDYPLKNFVTSGTQTGSAGTNVTLLPNEYTVIQLPGFTSTINCGPNEPATTGANAATRIWVNGLNGTGDPTPSVSSYQAFWNQKMFDCPGGYREQKAKTLRCENPADGSPQNDFTCGLPGFRYISGHTANYLGGGDPRASIYMKTYDIAANAYANNSSWKSRNVSSFNGNVNTNSPRDWPDGSHNVDNTLQGLPVTTLPTAAPAPPLVSGFTNGYVSVFSKNTNGPTAGLLTNICELGNVYDPAQWSGTPASTSWQPQTPSSSAGGGVNLRIGKPEFNIFNTNNARAAQLLDLFAITNIIRGDGLININTASYEVLCALGAGITASSDAIATPAALTNVSVSQTNRSGSVFANTVMSNRPFLSTSKLSWMTNLNGGFFGNTNQYQLPSMEWNDAAAKEYFGKVYNLATTRSRAFRVYTTGQILTPSGSKVLSTVNVVFNVLLAPQRDANGSVTNVLVQILYRKSL